MFAAGKRNDAWFILGIDLGNSASSLAYFDANRMSPETLDISGGYGRPTMPTVMQYVNETKEWVYGEYALDIRNSEADINVTGLLENLGKNHSVYIDKKPVSYAALMAMYLSELVGNCKSINPNAVAAGIVATLPAYIGDEAKEELLVVFEKAGLDRSLIRFADERECIFARYFYKREIEDSKLLLIDFGARQTRGGVYSVKTGSHTDITSLSSVFSAGIGTNEVHAALYGYFERIYCEKTGTARGRISGAIKEQLEHFTYRHEDVILQKAPNSGVTKLYFNFAYPPFEVAIDYRKTEELVEPYRLKFEEFLRDVFNKTYNSVKLSPSCVDGVICCGGGFGMLWARELIKRVFPEKKGMFFKNTTTAAAEGASIIAARELNVLERQKLMLTDVHRLNCDIGLIVKQKGRQGFVPLIERNSFWWQEHLRKYFIVSGSADKDVNIEICRRERDGKLEKFGDVTVSGLPPRPKNTTRLSVSMEFIDAANLVTTVKDAGFGELFPASDIEKEYIVRIN